MDIRKVTNDVSVATSQIHPQDVEAIKAAGFRSIICNRPDGEVPDQPTFEDIKAAAQEQGIASCYLPVISGQVTDEDAAAFGKALDELPSPVLAYCRTGTRSTTLWSLASAAKLPPEEILKRTRDAGYDMTEVVRYITARQG